jgi:hypothetical protein
MNVDSHGDNDDDADWGNHHRHLEVSRRNGGRSEFLAYLVSLLRQRIFNIQ